MHTVKITSRALSVLCLILCNALAPGCPAAVSLRYSVVGPFCAWAVWVHPLTRPQCDSEAVTFTKGRTSGLICLEVPSPLPHDVSEMQGEGRSPENLRAVVGLTSQRLEPTHFYSP